MNSPGLQQRTRCSISHGIGSLLLVHPLSSDETRVSPLQKGDNVPKILLLIEYPYGLSFLLWPYRDVHTFPMRYVTELACEHSYPLNSNLVVYFKQLDTLTIRTSSLKQLDTLKSPSRVIPIIRTRVPKQLDMSDIRTSVLKQLDNRYPHSRTQATGQSAQEMLPRIQTQRLIPDL